MRLRGKSVGTLTAEDITTLVENGVSESRTLEFKQQLPGADAEERREFLADASALANTAGGVILYGIETDRDASGSDTGIAKRVAGIGSVNLDSEQQRLLSMLKDGLSPAQP